MATRIIEYGARSRDDGLPVVPVSLREQTALTASGTTQQSAAVGNDCNLVCVDSDEAVHVKVGANPTATTACLLVGAGQPQYFAISAAQKVAIIQAS